MVSDSSVSSLSPCSSCLARSGYMSSIDSRSNSASDFRLKSRTSLPSTSHSHAHRRSNASRSPSRSDTSRVSAILGKHRIDLFEQRVYEFHSGVRAAELPTMRLADFEETYFDEKVTRDDLLKKSMNLLSQTTMSTKRSSNATVVMEVTMRSSGRFIFRVTRSLI